MNAREDQYSQTQGGIAQPTRTDGVDAGVVEPSATPAGISDEQTSATPPQNDGDGVSGALVQEYDLAAIAARLGMTDDDYHLPRCEEVDWAALDVPVVQADADAHEAPSHSQPYVVDTRTATYYQSYGVVFVPRGIHVLMERLGEYADNLEYGLGLTGCQHPTNPFVWLVRGFSVRDQWVTPYHFRFAGGINPQVWQGVIHRHPPSVTRFSLEDEEYLTPAFAFSLLFLRHKPVQQAYPDAVVSAQLGGLTIRVRPRVQVVDYPLAEGYPIPEDNACEGLFRTHVFMERDALHNKSRRSLLRRLFPSGLR